jgi:hypothetical protein
MSRSEPTEAAAGGDAARARRRLGGRNVEAKAAAASRAPSPSNRRRVIFVESLMGSCVLKLWVAQSFVLYEPGNDALLVSF